jgi:predicted O-methyltransferase YrrM
MLGRAVKNFLKGVSSAAFRFGQRVGVDVLPRHFYSSIPDIRDLSQNNYWRAPMDMVGVSGADNASQLAFALECCPAELRNRVATMDLVTYATRENGETGYGPIEAEFLYCFIATKKPAKIVQVGAGFTTAIILKAAEDANYAVNLVCVDPFPSEYLQRCHAAGKIKLYAEMAQTVDRDVLTKLGHEGMLFIDSTHAVKVGSEVNRLILDILPRLDTGAHVHFHDIYFPYDYQPDVLRQQFFSVESTLLHAFLINNSRFMLRCALSMLHHDVPDRLREIFPKYSPRRLNDGLENAATCGHYPSAAYLQVV